LLTLLTTLAHAAPPLDSQWDRLTSRPVPVECTEVSDVPWCRSKGVVVGAAPDQVAEALEAMKEGANAFESVLSVRVIAPNVIHVVLDYPAPLADRDYVARYTHTTDGGSHTYSWASVANEGAPETDEAVRLPHFAGSWQLEPHAAGTLVTYTWNAEIAGSFPTFAYKMAWKKAGHEALKDLAHTRGAQLSAPESLAP